MYFFTGLAGAGKTTLGSAFYRRRKAQNNATLLLDGDQLREFIPCGGYSTQERLSSGMQMFRICKLFTDQNIDVVYCSISMYDEIRDWNRRNFQNYREIYVKVRMDTLYRRDQKQLYSSGAKQVVGMDLPYDEPKQPTVVIENDDDEPPEILVDRIEEALGLR